MTEWFLVIVFNILIMMTSFPVINGAVSFRKHESLVEELHKKNAEIEGLKQKMQQLVALQSTWTPSLSPHH